MKILLNVYVEDGDTLDSIAKALSLESGRDYSMKLLWDFNRNVMPTPGSLPPIGSVIRVPVDPTAVSGAPTVEELGGARITNKELASASPVLGGLRTPSTDGGEVNAETPTYGSENAGATGGGVTEPNPGGDGGKALTGAGAGVDDDGFSA